MPVYLKLCELRAGVFALALMAAVLSSSGCGVKSTATTAPIEQPPGNPPANSTTPVLLALTDDTTATGVVSFYANISQVQITPRQGNNSTLYTSNATLEMTHLAGTTQYLAMTALSPGSYRNIIVSLNDPLITYIDSKGATVTEEFPNYTGSAEIDFAELLNVDTTGIEIVLDFNLYKSVVLDPVTGNMTLTPVFTAKALPIAASAPAIGTGLIESVLGTVRQYANNVLTLTTDIAQTTVGCNVSPASTTVNFAASAGLPQGALVRVNLAGQLDGSIHCARIEAVNPSSGAFAMAGTVNSYRGGTAPYQLTLAMQQGSGAGVSTAFIGSGINVNFDSPAAAFAIDWEDMDQSNLGFTPVFSAATFFPGQYVEASSAVPLLTTGNDIGAIPGSMITVAAMDATQVTLSKQDEEGTVSKVTTDAHGVTRFILTPAAGGVFAQYTALPVEPTGYLPTINVVVPAGASIDGSLTTTIAGAPAASLPYVKVRGLLFLNGATYTLVAQRVTATLPPSQPIAAGQPL